MLGCLWKSGEAVMVMGVYLWCECMRQKMQLVWHLQELAVLDQEQYHLDLLCASHPTTGIDSSRGPLRRAVAGGLQAA
jgi:hypothetical protein